ncbi:SAVED domain-containing protein [Glutamicibacter sp. TV12E]|uniref:SAVED domain-containing protein n=1 Tax=Glutamicibacter sp. TV12E TaxID=3446362 RepID=UPI0040341E73
MTGRHQTLDPSDPIFISYRQNDGTAITAELAWILRTAGIPVWRDRDDLPPGDTEERLEQAIAAGISGGILVVTPDVVNSRVVRMVEAPHLIELHQRHQNFVLGIANSVQNVESRTDYDAPDRLLARRPGQLSGVDQNPATREGLKALTRGLVWHRVASLRERVENREQTFNLSLQTRNTPQVYDRTGAELDIRLRPSGHERLPNAEGLHDLKDTIGLLPDAVTRSGAHRLCIRGGGHLSVGFAVGAALPSSRVGKMVVIDQKGVDWESQSESNLHDMTKVQILDEGKNQSAIPLGRPSVAIYIDLLPQRSDTAFSRFLEESRDFIVAWRHISNLDNSLIDPKDAGRIASEIAAHIRAISNENNNAQTHILLRCPFPLALLVGRLTNTLRCVVYEWDDSDPIEPGGDYRARYVPTLKVRASASDGAIEEVLI